MSKNIGNAYKLNRTVSDKLNILFLSIENPYPPNGGHHLRTYNILKILAKHHNVFFIGIGKNKNDIDNLPKIKEICEYAEVVINPVSLSKIKLIKMVTKNLFSAQPFIAQKYYIGEVVAKIKQVIQKYDISLVHLDMLPLAEYKKHLKDLPTVLVNHNVESVRLLRWARVERNIIKKAYLFYQYFKLKKYERNRCPIFNKTVVVSHTDKQILKELCHHDNFAVVPNGVDIRFFTKKENVTIKKNKIIWIGGMSGAYSADAVDYFLEKIYPLLNSMIKDVQIEFVGGAPTSYLQEMAKKDERIVARGFLENIHEAVSESAIFIAPLRSGSGTKIKILNALSFEKPVVTTSIGAEGIEAINGKEIIIADNEEDFAKNIKMLLENKDMAKQMGKKGRELVEKKYSWDVIESEMIKLYNQIAPIS